MSVVYQSTTIFRATHAIKNNKDKGTTPPFKKKSKGGIQKFDDNFSTKKKFKENIREQRD